MQQRSCGPFFIYVHRLIVLTRVTYQCDKCSGARVSCEWPREPGRRASCNACNKAHLKCIIGGLPVRPVSKNAPGIQRQYADLEEARIGQRHSLGSDTLTESDMPDVGHRLDHRLEDDLTIRPAITPPLAHHWLDEASPGAAGNRGAPEFINFSVQDFNNEPEEVDFRSHVKSYERLIRKQTAMLETLLQHSFENRKPSINLAKGDTEGYLLEPQPSPSPSQSAASPSPSLSPQPETSFMLHPVSGRFSSSSWAAPVSYAPSSACTSAMRPKRSIIEDLDGSDNQEFRGGMDKRMAAKKPKIK